MHAWNRLNKHTLETEKLWRDHSSLSSSQIVSWTRRRRRCFEKNLLTTTGRSSVKAPRGYDRTAHGDAHTQALWLTVWVGQNVSWTLRQRLLPQQAIISATINTTYPVTCPTPTKLFKRLHLTDWAAEGWHWREKTKKNNNFQKQPSITEHVLFFFQEAQFFSSVTQRRGQMHEMEHGAYWGKDRYGSCDPKSLSSHLQSSDGWRHRVSTCSPASGALWSRHPMSNFNPHVMLERDSPLSRRTNSSHVYRLCFTPPELPVASLGPPLTLSEVS